MTEKPHRSAARKNTLVVALVLGGLAAWNVHRHRPPVAGVLAGLAVVLCLMALLSPLWTERFNRAWMALASGLGYVNSRILLSLVYYLVMAPLGAVLRLTGHDPLRRRAPQVESYWIPRESPRQSKSGFERPF